MMKMDIILASQNAGKIIEYREAVKPHQLIATDIEVDEVGLSFQENALLKARACAAESGGVYIGDDSGIMIDVLGGMPGIHSKRWRGAQKGNEALENVLDALKDYPELQPAQMICVIALLRYKNDPLPHFFVGIQHGLFRKAPEGEYGFAYDPYFYIPGMQKTNAQLTLQEKNKVSHRAIAIAKLHAYLIDSN
jgi:XTP/dITP diphosphohydrolase